jgi:hypothetical protein
MKAKFKLKYEDGSTEELSADINYDIDKMVKTYDFGVFTISGGNTTDVCIELLNITDNAVECEILVDSDN